MKVTSMWLEDGDQIEIACPYGAVQISYHMGGMWVQVHDQNAGQRVQVAVDYETLYTGRNRR